MNNKTNTHQGSNVEHLLANSILDHPKAFKAVCDALSIPNDATPIEPSVVGGRKHKTDIEIGFNQPTVPPIRVSIKSFTGAGYNHLERRRLPTFCKLNQITAADTKFLIDIWLEKATGKRQLLVEDAEHERIGKIFSNIEPAASSLLGNDHPQIFALYSVNQSKFHFYDMNKQVLPLVRGAEIGFTTRAANIAIGDYIVLQRKGSEKGEAGNDIGHISHRANDIQIKMKVKLFFNDVEPISWYQL